MYVGAKTGVFMRTRINISLQTAKKKLVFLNSCKPMISEYEYNIMESNYTKIAIPPCHSIFLRYIQELADL